MRIIITGYTQGEYLYMLSQSCLTMLYKIYTVKKNDSKFVKNIEEEKNINKKKRIKRRKNRILLLETFQIPLSLKINIKV